VNAVVLNKMDLAPYVEFSFNQLRKAIAGMNRKAKLFQVSCRTGEGIAPWADWLEDQWRTRKHGA
jgi:hydrogenase nickel incorporation protein HypB